MKAFIWMGFPPESKDIPFESLNDIENFINSLDNETDLVLSAEDESTLTISKTNKSKYNVVFMSPNSDIAFYLTNEDVRELRNSKELERFKEIPYIDTIKAIKHYFEKEQMNPQQYWLELADAVSLKQELWSKTGGTGIDITLLN